MCRWLSYLGRPIYLEDLIYKPDHSLIDQSLNAMEAKVPTNGDGFGIGWYTERDEPGLYREVLPAWNDLNLRSLSHQIASGLFFAHVRASTGTETIRSNCHPFAHKNWMFMHNGQIGEYARVRRALEALIPDEFYGYRAGTTDSEILFFLLMANGAGDDVATAIRRTLNQVEKVMWAAGITQPLRCTAALSDGDRLVALRYASDDKPPSLYFCRDGDRTIVVSEPIDSNDETWQAVPPNHYLEAVVGAEPLVEAV